MRQEAAESTAIMYPATVEFDVVFPDNGTYAPASVFPIIFAVQNVAAAWPSTALSIQWSLVKLGTPEAVPVVEPTYYQHSY